MSNNIIVTGCERSGTTIIAQQLADYYDLPYFHEGYGDGVMKHSLNLNQNIKHLEWLDYEFQPKWVYILREGLDVITSIYRKIWQRDPHTVSLDEAIHQYKQVKASTWDWARGNADELLHYEFPDERFTYTPRQSRDYLTEAQQAYVLERL